MRLLVAHIGFVSLLMRLSAEKVAQHAQPDRSPDPDAGQALRRQFRVSDGMLDFLVPQKVLDQPRIHPLIRECIACRMTKHMGMDMEAQPRGLSSSLENTGDHIGAERPTALRDEHIGIARCNAKLPKRCHFIPIELVDAVDGSFEPADVKRFGVIQVEVSPLRPSGLGGTQAMPIHQAQQHLVTQAVAPLPSSSCDHRVRLVWTEVIAAGFFNMRKFGTRDATAHGFNPQPVLI